MDKHLDVKSSKCFTCIFGLCVKQKETDHILPVPSDDNEPVEPWKEGSEEKNAHSINHEGIMSVCFWPAIYLKQEIPIQMGFVEECNRYKSQNSDEKPLAKPKK